MLILTRKRLKMSKLQLYGALYETERRFRRACEQIDLLNRHLLNVNERYNAARAADRKVHRYTLRMRMMITEALLRTYCHYACQKRQEVIQLRKKAYYNIDEDIELSEEEEDIE